MYCIAIQFHKVGLQAHAMACLMLIPSSNARDQHIRVCVVTSFFHPNLSLGWFCSIIVLKFSKQLKFKIKLSNEAFEIAISDYGSAENFFKKQQTLLLQ